MSDVVTINSTSLEFVRAPLINPTVNGVAYDPTGDAVQMAFLPLGQADPQPGDWHTAQWEADVQPLRYMVKCLVGPGGGVIVQKGTYNVFVRITDNPEVPVKQAPNRLRVV